LECKFRFIKYGTKLLIFFVISKFSWHYFYSVAMFFLEAGIDVDFAIHSRDSATIPSTLLCPYFDTFRQLVEKKHYMCDKNVKGAIIPTPSTIY